MTRVLAAALISAMTFAASAGLASAATAPAAGGSMTGTSSATVGASADHAKATDSAKPLTTKKKAKAASATSHPAPKTQEVGKTPAKPNS